MPRTIKAPNQDELVKLVGNAVSTAVDTEEVTAEMSPIEKQEFLNDFNEYLKRDDEISGELTKLNEEYQALSKENEEEFNRLMKDMDLKGVIEKLHDLIKLAESIGNVQVISHYKNMMDELESSYTLDVLFKSINKVKNKAKIINQSEINFDKEMKKFREKLGHSTEYIFNDPIGIHTILTKYTSEEESRIILYSLSRFINTKGQDRISKYSLFLSQFIKNIYALDNNFIEAETLIANVKKYTSDLKA